MKKRDELRQWLWKALAVSVLAVGFLVIGLILFVPYVILIHIQARGLLAKMYRFFVDIAPEKRTFRDIKVEFPRSRTGALLEALYTLIEHGHVEEYVLDKEYRLVEYCWSGKPMKAKSPSARKGLTHIQRLRLDRL